MVSDPDQDKLDDLAKRIHQANKDAKMSPASLGAEPETEPYRHSMKAYRIGTDFAVTVLACMGVGWFFDRWLGIAPWGLLLLLVVGFVAGLMNMWRVMKVAQNNGTAAKE